MDLLSQRPITVFMAHLKRLGWALHPDFRCDLQDGRTLRLNEISAWQFKRLALESWESAIVPKIKHRSGFEELTSFSSEASAWDNSDIVLNGFMMTLRAGGLFTNRAKAKFTGCTDKCVLYGELDGMQHRIYECGQTGQVREQVDWALLQSLPRHCLMWGIFSLPAPQLRFWTAMDNLAAPDTAQLPAGILSAPDFH